MASSSKKRDPSSITPQRKHRKLLKDGSGTEVWPEAIEKIFVQGLREYWDSPYATYSQSRGRSRWRNQFLVDYLQKQGIERSKKQVASHIQVLRNMWKGEPEFHLVAGGDEAYPEASSPISVKAEEHWESNTVPVAYEWDEHDNTPSNSVSPDFSPADSQSEFPPTPEHRPNLYPAPDSKLSLINFSDYAYPTNPAINSPSISPQGDYIRQLPPFHDSPSNPPLLIHPKYQSQQSPSSPLHSHHRRTGSDVSAMNRHMSITPTHHHSCSVSTAPVLSTPRNKVLSVFLSAEGMTLFQVKVDALGLPHPTTGAAVQPPFSLRIRLGIPIAQDPRAPSSLAGFTAALTLESVWSASSRIHTKTYSGNVCVNDEMGSLDVTHITVGTVHAVMSESTLNKCRWLDHSLPVLITQEIIVDEETLLFVIYELDRRNGGQSMPSATLLGYQKYRGSTSTSTAAFGLHSHHPSPLGPSPNSPLSMTMPGLGLGGSSMPMGLAPPLSSTPGANSNSHAHGYPRSPSLSSTTAMGQSPSYGMSQPQPVPAYRLGTTGLKY